MDANENRTLKIVRDALFIVRAADSRPLIPMMP